MLKKKNVNLNLPHLNSPVSAVPSTFGVSGDRFFSSVHFFSTSIHFFSTTLHYFLISTFPLNLSIFSARVSVLVSTPTPVNASPLLSDFSFVFTGPLHFVSTPLRWQCRIHHLWSQVSNKISVFFFKVSLLRSEFFVGHILDILLNL